MLSCDKQRRLDGWRSSLGACHICGQCLGAPRHFYSYQGDAVDDSVDNDGLLLTEECPVRLCLMRFNMLGSHQEAHLVDDYTFLDGKRNGTNFMKEIETHFDECILPLNTEAFDRFKGQVLNADNSIYTSAVSNMQRSVVDRTVPACQRCNRAMYRAYEHSMAVYRCFHVTADSDSTLMEGDATRFALLHLGKTDSTDAGRTKPGNKARKVVQQIGLYFTYDGTTWRAKPSEQLMLDAAIWRCIAFLFSWGEAPAGGGVRLRLIALFYASYYIYTKGSSMRGAMRFEDWHTYVWRPMCMSSFAAGTFLGMTQSDAANRIDLARAKTGRECMRIVTQKLRCVSDTFLAQWEASIQESRSAYKCHYDFSTNSPTNTTREQDIVDRIRAAVGSVRDERSLLVFLSDKRGGKHGIGQLFSFFCYNFLLNENRSSLLQSGFMRFKESLQYTHSKLIGEKKKPSSEAFFMSLLD